MIGYVPGDSPLHRAHPYTPLTCAGAVLLLVFAVRSPSLVWLVVAIALLFALVSGTSRAVLGPALLLAAPTWIVLLVLHGLLGEPPRMALGPLSVSQPGIARALVLGGRIGAIVIAFLAALATVSPPRLVDAMTDRGAPFARSFLLVSTLTFLPRMRERAARILEAQQARGLRIGGSPLARFRALAPLILPLVLGALAEVDEQVLALEARGATSAARRTALAPPPDRALEKALRGLVLAIACTAWTLRIRGML